MNNKEVSISKKMGFGKIWRRWLLDRLKKDISDYPEKKNYNYYTNGSATFSQKDLVSFYYTIDGYPSEMPINFKSRMRKLAKDGVRVTFISLFEPTRLDWGSAKMRSRLKTWKSISDEEKVVDEFNYRDNLSRMDSEDRRKRSLLYLADAELRRNRKLFVYRTVIVISGVRGSNFDTTVRMITDYCSKISLTVTRIEDNLMGYLRGFSPFSLDISSDVLKGIGSTTIPDEMLARFNTYDQGKIGTGGTLWGLDIYSGFPVYKMFKRSSVDAENILITAETGGGKSFLLKWLIFQLLAQPQYNGTINDIEGFEYIPLANFFNANDDVVILNMAEGQGCYFDPVEINMVGDAELDEDMYSFSISFTLSVLKTLLGEDLLKNSWCEIIINNAVAKAYSDMGVSEDDPSSWNRSRGYTLFDIYAVLKDFYVECVSLINRYGYSTDTLRDEAEASLSIDNQIKRNKEYRSALDLAIAKLASYFEPLELGGVRSNVFKNKVSLDTIKSAKLVVCSFGMKAKADDTIDPIQMGLTQLSASNISYIRSIFSKAAGKYNFKVWEEFQRWGGFPGSEKTIKTALTGGRKLGDVNFILTNDVKALLEKDRFAILGNITSFALGAIGDGGTRAELCKRLSIPLLQVNLDMISDRGSTETFNNESDSELISEYDKAFLVRFDKQVNTIMRVILPNDVAKSNLFRSGVNIST